MTESRAEELEAKLKGLVEAIVQEASGNPVFAKKVEAALSLRPEHADDKSLAARLRQEIFSAARTQQASHPMLQNAAQSQSFDPLELHLEAAIIGGMEQEARAFLGKLDRAQLEQVVKAQRLPGARALQKAIAEAQDPSTAVDAIVGSAAEKVRGRFLAAR